MPKKSRPKPADLDAPRQGAAFERLDALIESLAHPTRRQIVLALAVRGPMPAGDVAERFKVAWPTITRHLTLLEGAGAIRVKADGRRRIYSLEADALIEVIHWLEEVRALAAAAPQKPSLAGLGYAEMPGTPVERPEAPARRSKPAK